MRYFAPTRAPEAVPGGARWASVQGSPAFGCGLTADGLARCWGTGAYGARGDGVADAPVSGAASLTTVAGQAGVGPPR